MADLYYIEQGYYDTDGYFAYVANADAALAPQFTCSVSALIVQTMSADLTSSATLSATGQKLLSGEATLLVEETVTVDAIVVKDAASSVTSNFTQSADASLVKNADSSVTGNFTLTAQGLSLHNGNAAVSSNFTLTGDGVLTKYGQSSLASEFAVTAQSASIHYAESSLTSSFTTSVSANVTHNATLDIVLPASLEVEGRILKEASIYVDSFAELVVDMVVTHGGSADCAGSFTVDATSRKLNNGQLDATSDFAVSASGGIVYDLAEDFTTNATVTADGSYVWQAQADTNTSASVTVSADKIFNAVSDISSNFVLGIDYTVIKQIASDVTVTADLSATGEKILRDDAVCIMTVACDVSAGTIYEAECLTATVATFYVVDGLIKQISSSLNVHTDISVSADVTHEASADLTSSASVEASCVRIQSISSDITATVTTESTAGLILQGSVIGGGTGLYAYSGIDPSITGIEFDGDEHHLLEFGSAGVVSFWARRKTSTSTGNILDNRSLQLDVNGNLSSILNIQQIRIDSGNTIVWDGYDNNDGATPQYLDWIVTWADSMPSNTNWNHFFFKFTKDGQADYIELFVNGVSQGNKHVVAQVGPDEWSGTTRVYFDTHWGIGSNPTGVKVKTTPVLYGNGFAEYQESSQAISGFEQFYTGLASGSVSVSTFYNGGFVDFGASPSGYDTKNYEMFDYPFGVNTYSYSNDLPVTLTTDYKANPTNQVLSKFTLVVSGEIAYKQGEADLTSAFTSSVSAINYKNASADLTSTATLAVDYLVIDFAEANLNSEFALTTAVELYKNASADLSAEFTQTTPPHVLRNATSDVVGIFSQVTAGESMAPVLSGQIDLTSQFTQTVAGGTIQQISSNQSFEFTQTVSADVNHTGQLDVNSEFTANFTAFLLKESSIIADNFAHLDCEGIVTFGASLDATAQFVLLADAVTQPPVLLEPLDLLGQFTSSATGGINLESAIAATSIFSFVCSANSIPSLQANADLPTIFTQTVSATSTPALQASANLQTNANLEATGEKVIGFVGDNITFNALLEVSGRISNVRAASTMFAEYALSSKLVMTPKQDLDLTIYVPSETRGIMVLPENRIAEVESEDRGIEVLPESRLIPVDSETRINILL